MVGSEDAKRKCWGRRGSSINNVVYSKLILSTWEAFSHSTSKSSDETSLKQIKKQRSGHKKGKANNEGRDDDNDDDVLSRPPLLTSVSNTKPNFFVA